MSNKEIYRVEILERLSRREIKQKKGAKLLDVSVRQVKRLVKKYRSEGTKGLVHKARGKTSNNRISQEKLDQAMMIIKEKYWDFGPTLAHEKLVEEHGYKLSLTSIRKEMILVGIWKSRGRKRAHVHQLRERRSCFGELVQIDGSPHDWFEGRGPRCNLNVMIDDATGRFVLRFSLVETTQDYFEIAERYFKEYGLPRAIYADKHSIFRVNKSAGSNHKKPTKTSQAHQNKDYEGLTQFGRAMKQLGIELIFANTPQAKGRVERLNKTMQDRLVKEMRLKNISSIKEANQFLETFSKKLNHKFSIKPRSAVNMHRKKDKQKQLEKILCTKEERVLSKNLTFQHNNTVYQIKTKRSAYTLRKTRVTICERYDGSVNVLDNKNKELEYTKIKKLENTKALSSKEINARVDAILRTEKKKKNYWETSQQELFEEVYFYKPIGAV